MDEEHSFIYRLENATDRACIISVLNNIKKILLPEVSCGRYSRDILHALLCQIKPSFLGLITESEFQKYFVGVFVTASPEDALMTIAQWMRGLVADYYKLRHLLILLSAVEKDGFCRLFDNSICVKNEDDSSTVLYYELSQLVIAIPDLMYNLLGQSWDKWSTLNEQLEGFLDNHYKFLLDAIKKSLLEARRLTKINISVNLKFVSAVLPAMFRGSAKCFSQLIYWMEQHEESSIWKYIGWRVFVEDSDRFLITEDIVLHVAIAAADGRSLFRLFDGRIVFNRAVIRVLFYKLLLIKVFDLDVMMPRKLAECLNVGCSREGDVAGPWTNLYLETVLNVLRTWSDTVHLTHSTDEHRRYIDNALLWLVRCAEEKMCKKLASSVNKYLVNGMNAHLSCSDIHRRYRGMFIAESLTKCLSLGQLSFEYPDEAGEDIKDLKFIVNYNLPLSEVSKSNKENSVIFDKIDSTYQFENNDTIDAEVLDSQFDSDDDEFPTYEIPDTEKNPTASKEGIDSQKCLRPPHYIRDCMEDLNESENYAKFEAAFGALNSLIRKRAVAYDEIASELVRKLIFLTDRYKTDRFQERRLEMVTSCLVMSPQLVSVVVEIMFSRSCSMYGRYLILEAISKAASELSNSGYNEESIAEINKPKQNVAEKSWQSLIMERVAAKTKYFGKKKPVNRLRKNFFANYASSFFYSLSALEQYREHLDLLHRDYSLLAKILLVMSNIIYCAENCPATPRMARVLSDYLLPLQGHAESMVRQAVLYGYCSICFSLSPAVLLQFFNDDLPGWFQYSSNLGDSDPSSVCREMGTSVASLIAYKMKQVDEACFEF
uniref:Telomere_reg-2 domain-containing protein n=1 Tax=Syphacia muris TaxID=451379 RepID=A0A0N5APS8_9BILA